MLIFYHISLTLFMWSYWRTIMTSVGRIPEQVRESGALSVTYYQYVCDCAMGITEIMCVCSFSVADTGRGG